MWCAHVNKVSMHSSRQEVRVFVCERERARDGETAVWKTRTIDRERAINKEDILSPQAWWELLLWEVEVLHSVLWAKNITYLSSDIFEYLYENKIPIQVRHQLCHRRQCCPGHPPRRMGSPSGRASHCPSIRECEMSVYKRTKEGERKRDETGGKKEEEEEHTSQLEKRRVSVVVPACLRSLSCAFSAATVSFMFRTQSERS